MSYLSSIQSVLSSSASISQQIRYARNVLSTLSIKNILNGVYLHSYESGAKVKGALVNLTSNEVKYFQYNPETAKYSRKVNYSKVDAPGMQYPVFYFVNGAEMETDLVIFLYDNPSTGVIGGFETFIKGLLPSENNTEMFKKPPEVLYIFGQESFRCVVSSYEFEIKRWDDYSYPIMATFTLHLIQTGGAS